MKRTTWWSLALLGAALIAVPGCKSADTTSDEAPPPEMTAQDEGSDAAADTMKATEDAMGEAENGAEEATETGNEAASEAQENANEGTEEAGESGSQVAETNGAESGLALIAVAGDDGTVTIEVNGEAVGTIEGGQVSDELSGWLKAQYESDSGAQITLEVPVSLKFDEVGMPLMKACFGAGFAPAQVTYKPVAN